MKKILFLDLEGTIIRSWDDPDIINRRVIKQFIADGNYDEISIFSFAIYNVKELTEFISKPMYKESIEHALGITLNVGLIPCIDTLRVMMAEEYNLPPSKVTRDDYFSFNNKESGFITYCRLNFKNTHCTLLDDMIWDQIEMIVMPKNVGIRTVNVLGLI